MFSGKRVSGIQGKTAFIFIGVFVIIIIPVNALVYSRVRQILIEADTKEIVSEGDKLFTQVRLDPQQIPFPPLGYSIYVQAGNEFQTDSIFASPNFPIDVPALILQSPIEIDTFKIITLSRLMEYGNAKLFFSIARSNQRLELQLSELRLYLIAANLVSIFIAGMLVYLVSGYTLRPIRKIIDVAQRINASKSIERVPVPNTVDENRQLAQTINNMLQRIENSIKNQTNFFASAAHELKTPLAVMQTELSVLLNKGGDEFTSRVLQNQLDEVQRLDRLIQDFLLISQLKSETLVIRKTEGRLDEALYAAMKRCKYLIRNKETQIQIVLSEETDLVATFDFDKLEILFTNLLENAIKFSAAGATIQVTFSKNPDTSIEFCNPLLESISEIASLKNEFTKSKELSGGLGMGLWICNEILKLHGGELLLSQQDQKFFAKVIV